MRLFWLDATLEVLFLASRCVVVEQIDDVLIRKLLLDRRPWGGKKIGSLGSTVNEMLQEV